MSRVTHGAQAIAIALALALALTTSGCASDATRSRTTEVHGERAATGSVIVFAAASLTEAFGVLQSGLEASAPGLDVTYSFAGSGSLVAQIEHGAPADVVATADTASMKRLADAGLVELATTFARNKLTVLVESGNPKGVTGLADLSRTDLKVVLGDETVPAGRYAAQALKAAGVGVKPVSREADVKAAVAKVTSGEADVTIVYASDARAAGSNAQGIEIPAGQNVVAEYPIAIVKNTPHRAASAAFVDAVVHGAGQVALRTHGFGPAA